MNIKKLIHYLDDESLNLLVNKIKEGKISLDIVEEALPFFNDAQINEIYQLIINHQIDMELETILPFLNDQTIEELFTKVQNNEITNIDVEKILPFLNTNKIKSLFMDYINKL